MSGKRFVQAAFTPLLALALLIAGCSPAEQAKPTDPTDPAPASFDSTSGTASTVQTGPPQPTVTGSAAVDEAPPSPTAADPVTTAADPAGTPADPVTPAANPVDTLAAQGDSGDLGTGYAIMPTLIGRTVAQARSTMSPAEVIVTDLTGSRIDGQDGQIVCRQTPAPDQPVGEQISLAVADTC